MLTAKEAHELSMKRIDVSAELEMINIGIHNNATAGQTVLAYEPTVEMNKDLLREIKRVLHIAGYSVGWVCSKNKLIIKW